MTARWNYLTDLINTNGWITGIEIGLGDGRNFEYLLRNCPRLDILVGVDPFTWDGNPDYNSMDHNKNYMTCKRIQSAYSTRAVLILETSIQVALKYKNDENLHLFDFVFIDADHRAPSVSLDIFLWKDICRNILGHDIDWPEVKAAVEWHYETYETGPDNTWFGKKLFTR